MSLVCVGILLALAAFAAIFARVPGIGAVVYAGCGLTAIGGLVAAVPVLVSGAEASQWVLPLGLPWMGMHFSLDPLAAFFLTVVNLGAGAVSLYAIGYGRHESEPGRILPFYPAFLAGMNLVVLAADAFSFLLSWEFMSLTSWALVMAHHRDRETAHAGYVYIVMAAFGTFALLLAFGMLAGPDGAYGFSAMRSVAGRAPWQEIAIFTLVLLGAGSKAGLVPLHVWLPLAHPAAPSHVSALMSGVMTKVAIYGFIRIIFDLLGAGSWEGAAVLLAVGGFSAVFGVLQAMLQTDIKKILASSTVENIGIIFIGLGLSMAFRAGGMTAAAALALSAALFHVLNHMLFKSLLFMGAGAVVGATGARAIDAMGGLIHRMPVTAACVLVGCAAISALPPLNGFASEWMLFQSVLQSPALPQWGLKVGVPAAGCLLALAAALAAACFVRLYGVAFLGRARGENSAKARETDLFSRAAMGILALACVIVGIAPGFFLGAGGIEAVASHLASEAGTGGGVSVAETFFSIVPVSQARSAYDALAVFLFVILAASAVALGARRLASSAVRRAPTWDCGFPDSSPQTQYGAGSIAQPIRRVFGAHIFHAREAVDMPRPGELRPASLRVTWRDPAWDWIFQPIGSLVLRIAERSNVAQFLTIRKYLGLVFSFLIFLLTVLALWT